jgi:hypothetical protein
MQENSSEEEGGGIRRMIGGEGAASQPFLGDISAAETG